jgi:UTP:GlnB (protein PII) uridylyltransferase
MAGYSATSVTVDDLTSKAHTVLQVRTRDRKGLLFDCMRATKDLQINVSYGKARAMGRLCCQR